MKKMLIVGLLFGMAGMANASQIDTVDYDTVTVRNTLVVVGSQTVAGTLSVTGALTATGGVTGNAATATALAANPADCSANQFANAIAASGALTCAAVGNAATTAASANTASAIVTRDASGNFSATNIQVSSNITSGNPSGYLGVWAATPTAHNIGDTYFDTYHTAVGFSTATFAASASGWLWSTLEAGTAVWTTYE